MAMTERDWETWHTIPGQSEWHRRYDGLLALYVGPAGKRGPRGTYRPGFDHRWTIWFSGALVGEGFTDNERAAQSACEQEAERVRVRICDLVKANLDIRNADHRMSEALTATADELNPGR